MRGVVDVAGDFDVGAGEAGIEAGEIRRGRGGMSAAPPSGSSRPAASRKRAPRARANTHAAVVGGGAADADEDALDAFVESGADEVAGAAGGGEAGVAFGGFKESEAGGGGHFEDGGLAVAGEAPGGRG